MWHWSAFLNGWSGVDEPDITYLDYDIQLVIQDVHHHRLSAHLNAQPDKAHC